MKKNICIQLLNEGTVCYRPVTAVKINDDEYQIIKTNGYDSATEDWEFPPGSIVNVKEHRFSDNSIGLLAINLKIK